MNHLALLVFNQMRALLLFLLLSICSCVAVVQASTTEESVSLTITDSEGQTLPFASVVVESAGLTYTADAQGQLRLKLSLFSNKGTRVTVSYLGKATRSLTITQDAVAKNKKINIALEDNNLYLKGVQVNATRTPIHSNSSILIQRNTIDNIQAYSMADIVQTLPGKAILNTDMHNASFLTLRSALQGDLQNPLDAYSRNKLNDYVRNAAFGIAYVVDGTPISNNTNMQLDSYGKWGGVKMFDRRFNTDNNENVGSGNDLRLIPASSIESVEVISGVAPVKYGDLSSGAVIINRRAGLTPFFGSVKVQYDIFNASLGKGFSLGERWGLLNLNVDYMHSTRDRRDRLKTNSNIAFNATWTHTLSKALGWENTISADFSKNIDGLKSDPDAKLNRTRTDRQNFRLSFRGLLSPQENAFVDAIDYNLSLSLSHQYDMHEEFIANNRLNLITDAYTNGLHETDVAPPYYNALLEIDGKPLALSGNVEARRTLKWGQSTHTLSLGIFARHESNHGKGKIFNAETPFYDGGQGGRGDRSYKYHNRIKLNQSGFYLQDKFMLPTTHGTLSATAGVRLEFQNQRFAASPRFNTMWAFDNGLSFNAAYGISYKIPATAYLYPENVYFDRLVYSNYSNNANERLFIYKTKVIDPTNPNLRSPYTHSFELGTTYAKSNFNTSLTGYLKIDQRGISSEAVLDTMWVQRYETLSQQPNQRPVYAPKGAPELIIDSYFTPRNQLYSRNAGLEWIGGLRNIRPIGLDINFSVVYNYSFYYQKGERMGTSIDLDKEAVAGIYKPTKNSSNELISTLSLTKQIASLGLIFNLRLQNFWFRHFNRYGFDIYPIGYYNQSFQRVYLNEEQRKDIRWTYIRLKDNEPVEISQPLIIPNCHLRVSKEIGKKLRLSCYINNVFNYRPWIERQNERIYFNQPPTVSMDVSYKF
ncbi:MAG: TonB-dependent receptor [Prevotella salivae]|nr:TonB-dependent receptor [Segatella salivae]